MSFLAKSNHPNEKFLRHLEKSHKMVEKWPRWKQIVLGYKNSSLEKRHKRLEKAIQEGTVVEWSLERKVVGDCPKCKETFVKKLGPNEIISGSEIGCVNCDNNFILE